MNFLCAQCGDNKDFMTQFSVLLIEKWGAGIKRFCKLCRKPKSGLLDVYFKGEHVDENLRSWDFPSNTPITSRADKLRRMKACNVREAGDRVHGATSFDPISHRHAEASLRR